MIVCVRVRARQCFACRARSYAIPHRYPPPSDDNNDDDDDNHG